MVEEGAFCLEVTVYSAWSYWVLAADAAERAQKEGEARPGDPTQETRVAIIMAAVAAETFINELPASIRAPWLDVPPPWSGIADAMEALEEGNAQIVPKYLVAALLLGSPLDKKDHAFEDFKILVNLRNGLVHQKVMTEKVITGIVTTHRLVDFFEQRKMTHKVEGLYTAGWVNRISTPKVARWACRASADIVLEIIGRLANDSRPDHPDFPILHSEWKSALDDPRVKEPDVPRPNRKA